MPIQLNFELFFGAFALLQALDIWTTHRALSHGGAKEANGFMAAIMKRLGVLPALLITKAVLIAAAWFVPTPVWSQWVLLLIYLVVIVNNFRVLKRSGAI